MIPEVWSCLLGFVVNRFRKYLICYAFLDRNPQTPQVSVDVQSSVFYFLLQFNIFLCMIPFQPFFQAQDSTDSIKALSHPAAPHLPRQWLPHAPWRVMHTSSWSISPRTGLGCRKTVTVSSRQMDVLSSQLKPGQHNPSEQCRSFPNHQYLYLEKPWSVKLFEVLLYYEAFF